MAYKKGDSANFANYRYLSMLNTTLKLYARCIRSRLQTPLETCIRKTQHGFRAGRGTQHAIHCVRRAVDT
eukprot:1311925-Prorocentrum_lima.AAC.1